MHRLTHAAQKRIHLALCSGGRALAPLGSLCNTLPVDALTAGQLLAPAPDLLCLAGSQKACLSIFLSLQVLCRLARQAQGLHLLERKLLEVGCACVNTAQAAVGEVVIPADGAGVAGNGAAQVGGVVATSRPDSASCNSKGINGRKEGLARLDAFWLGLWHGGICEWRWCSSPCCFLYSLRCSATCVGALTSCRHQQQFL